MRATSFKPLSLALILIVGLTAAGPMAALQTPSKTAPDQSLAELQADLDKIEAVVAEPEIAEALARHGLSDSEVHERLAQLSPEEIHALSSQLDQLQAAGASVPTYIWILLAVLLGVLILGAFF